MEEFALIDVIQGLSGEMQTLSLMMMVINFILHVIFAGAIARDSGSIAKHGGSTYLVSGLSWAFATLVGGVIVAGLYWAIHHSSLSRR